MLAGTGRRRADWRGVTEYSRRRRRPSAANRRRRKRDAATGVARDGRRVLRVLRDDVVVLRGQRRDRCVKGPRDGVLGRWTYSRRRRRRRQGRQDESVKHRGDADRQWALTPRAASAARAALPHSAAMAVEAHRRTRRGFIARLDRSIHPQESARRDSASLRGTAY